MTSNTSVNNGTVTFGGTSRIDDIVLTGVSAPSTPCTAPTAGPTSLTFGTPTSTTISGSFTAPSPAADSFVVFASSINTTAPTLANGTSYSTANQPTDYIFISKGTGTSFAATGLSPSTNYNFFVFAYNGLNCTGGAQYNTTPATGQATTAAATPACVAPASAPTVLMFPSTTTTSIDGAFTGTTADGYVVFRAPGGTSAAPILTNGTAYTVGSTVQTNYTVVANGTGATFTTTGLTPNTTYNFFVFGYNNVGCTGGPAYGPSLSGSQATQPLPPCPTPDPVTALSVTPATTTASGSFTAPAAMPTGYTIFYAENTPAAPTLTNGTTYSASVEPSGYEFGANQTSTAFGITGLNPNQQYTVFVFAYNSGSTCTGGPVYSSVTSASFTTTASTTPAMTELVVPRFMGGATNAAAPFAALLRFTNLTANTVYNLRTQLALTSDATSSYGAGNVYNGTAFSGNTLNNAFTTDGTGAGQVWVFYQQTGNTRFDPGQDLFVRASVSTTPTFPGTPQFVGTKPIRTLDIATTTPASQSTAGDGAYLKGTTNSSLSGDFVLLFDNVAGTGDPLFAYQVRQTTATQASQNNLPTDINGIYNQSGTSAVGDFPAVIPSDGSNANGVRRFEFRTAANTFIAAVTDADGVWGTNNTSTIARRTVQQIDLFQGTMDNFENADTVALTAATTITGTLTLSAGRILTGTGSLTLGTTATAPGTLAYTGGTIEGTFTRWVAASTGSYAFPMGRPGTGEARVGTVDFTMAPAAGGTLTAFVDSAALSTINLPVTTDGTCAGPFTATTLTGQYLTINAGNGLVPGTYDFSLIYDNPGGVTDACSLAIAKRADENAPWSIDGIQDFGTGSSASVTVRHTGISTGFSDFIVAGAEINPLPVVLTRFDATAHARTARLSWTLADREGLSAQILERSTDGRTFSAIGTAPLGTDGWVDAAPATGANHYRLRLHSADGSVVISAVRTLTFSGPAAAIAVFPNPAQTVITVQGAASATLFDAAGRAVRTATGAGAVQLSVEGLAGGVYLIQATDASGNSIRERVQVVR